MCQYFLSIRLSGASIDFKRILHTMRASLLLYFLLALVRKWMLQTDAPPVENFWKWLCGRRRSDVDLRGNERGSERAEVLGQPGDDHGRPRRRVFVCLLYGRCVRQSHRSQRPPARRQLRWSLPACHGARFHSYVDYTAYSITLRQTPCWYRFLSTM